MRTAGEQQKRIVGRPFEKGVSGNPKGRPKGKKSFTTIWNDFVYKLAETNEIQIDDIERQLLATAYKKAKDGDFSFYKDIFDRVYGKAIQPTDITTDGNPLVFLPSDVINKLNGTNTETKGSDTIEQPSQDTQLG